MRFTEVKLPIRPGDRHWVPAPGDVESGGTRDEGIQEPPVTVICGEALEELRKLPDCSIDACVTDPPYGIRFMGKAWDGKDIEARTAIRGKFSQDPSEKAGHNGGHKSVAAEAGKYDLRPSANLAFQLWTQEWAAEMFRVLKPGAHLVSFASTRTYHRMTAGIEDAGFEIRDQLAWVFGSGFPKSHNLEGEGDGWGTALKPAWEPIVLARKPLVGTVAVNVAAHGTGAIHIDACRIEGNADLNAGNGEREKNPQGRWPANLLHDGSDEVVAMFPSEAGAFAPVRGTEPTPACDGSITGKRGRVPTFHHGDSGSAARFFYCAKASRADRNDGLEGRAKRPLNWSSGPQSPGTFQSPNTDRNVENHHPTVKPTDVMRWLCRLVTPPGGKIVDPFTGSGSTGRGAVLEGFGFLGFDQDAEYCDIARARIAACRKLRAEELAAAAAQPELFVEKTGERGKGRNGESSEKEGVLL